MQSCIIAYSGLSAKHVPVIIIRTMTMLNPNNHLNFDSYQGLRGRMLQHLRSGNINDHIFEVVRAACDAAIAADNLILSQPEKRRLLADVLKSVLTEMDRRLDQADF